MFVKILIASFLLVTVVNCQTTTPASNTTTEKTTVTTLSTSPSPHSNATTKPTSSTHQTNATTKSTSPSPHTNATTKSTSPSPHTNATTKSTSPSPHTNVTTKPTSPTTTQKPSDHEKVTLALKDNKTNTTCVLMQGQFLLSITYNMTDGKTNTTKVGIPKDSEVTGSCIEKQEMNIMFEGITLSIRFDDDKTNIMWSEVNTTVEMNARLFPNHTGTSLNFTAVKQSAFKASKDGSYLCNSDTTTDFGGVTLETWDFQYTAYQKNVTAFSKDNVSQCKADSKTNSIVPIAVGAALAGLVVIVLIAYLIGRRRNRKGYESV